jgi:heptosyltransferase-1
MAFLRQLGVSCDADEAMPRVVITSEDVSQANQILNVAGIGSDESIAAFCPATTHQYKHWTEEGWTQLAENTWNELRIRPVFLGSKADKPLVTRILSMTNAQAVDITGETTLKQASAVVDKASLTISVDTGLLHVSVALGKPTVGVFGPTMAWQNHVHHPHFAVVRKAMECAPCRKKPTCQRFDCISDVKPEDVLVAAQQVLSHSWSKGIGD